MNFWGLGDVDFTEFEAREQNNNRKVQTRGETREKQALKQFKLQAFARNFLETAIKLR
jgi:hypothetical protein